MSGIKRLVFAAFTTPLTIRGAAPSKQLFDKKDFDAALYKIRVGSMITWPYLASKRQIDVVRQRVQRVMKHPKNHVKKKEFFVRVSRTTMRIWVGRIY